MSCTIDHLRVDHRVRVLREFTDLTGQRIPSGTTAVIRRLELDWPQQQIVLTWERNQQTETLRFALNAATGPRNGGMRDYFAVGAPRARTEDNSARPKHRAIEPLPPLTETPVTGPARGGDAVALVRALAARGRFAEAEVQLRQLLAAPDEHGGILEGLADAMVGAAEAHRRDDDPIVYSWLRDQAINLWYAWGSQATSGGDGAARAPKIRAAEARLPPRPVSG